MNVMDGGWDAGFREEDYDFRSYQPDLLPKDTGYLKTADVLEEEIKQTPLNERVQLKKEGIRQSEYLIDSVLIAKTVSDIFRGNVVNHWIEHRSTYQIRAWAALVITAFTAGAVACGLTPYIAAATIISGIYSVYEFYRARNALHQINGWKIRPASAVALQRKEAYEKGFVFAFDHNLKLDKQSNHAVLLPFEVLHLFDRYTTVFSQKLSMQNCSYIKQKKAWLDSFLDHNPMSKEMLVFTFGKIPERYASISLNFELLKESLDTIKKDFNLARLQAKADHQNLLSEIESKRSFAQMPLDRILNAKLEEARQVRNEKLEEEGRNLAAVEEDYKIKVDDARAIHKAATATIRTCFDGKVDDAKEKLSFVLKQMELEEADSCSPYYTFAKGLIIATLNAVQDPSYIYKGPAFSKEEAIHIPIMPKIEVLFDYPKYEAREFESHVAAVIA